MGGAFGFSLESLDTIMNIKLNVKNIKLIQYIIEDME